MKTIEMSPINTHITRRGERVDITVDGGWSAFVPEVTPDEDSRLRFTRYYQSDGFRPAIAEQKALETVQRGWEQCYVKKLRDSIRYWVQRYTRKYGDVRGFDPERMQGAFMMGENVGRRGKRAAITLMREMREEIENG